MPSKADTPAPPVVVFRGSRLARWVLACGGWQVKFAGLPAKQGVVVVYPHTSNWDFVVLVLAKWAIGIEASFWGKDTLFKIPLFASWLRWIGGLPVVRDASYGVVGQAIERFKQSKANDTYFWLGLSPEGTRKPTAGWRSGFYQTALQAGVPVLLVSVDYAHREVVAMHHMRLSGDKEQDFRHIAHVLQGVRAKIAAHAAPIRLMDAPTSRNPSENP